MRSFTQTSFRNPVMERELCLADLDGREGAKLLAAIAHLESPCPTCIWNRLFSSEWVAQVKEALPMLKEHLNVVLVAIWLGTNEE